MLDARNYVFADQLGDDDFGHLLRGSAHSVQMDFGGLRRLVWRVDAGEIFDPTVHGLGVKPLRIAPNAFVDRRVDEYLDELPRRDQTAHHLALRTIGRNERAQHDEPAFHHQLSDFAGPTDVFHAVGFGKAEIAAQPVADIVAVKQHGVMTHGVQALFHQVGDRRLAGAGKAGEPDDGRLLALQGRALALVEQQLLPRHVGAAAQAEGDHASAQRAVAHAVYNNERAGPAIRLVGIEGNRRGGGQITERNVVETERGRRQMFATVGVDAIFYRRYGDRGGFRRQPRQIGAARHQRLAVHPDEVGGELIGNFGTRSRADQDVAAADVYLIGQRHRYRHAGTGGGERSVGSHDLLHPRAVAGRGHRHGVADLNASARHRAGVTAKIRTKAIHPLHGKAERLLDGVDFQRDGFETLDQRRPVVPWRVGGAADDIVAEPRRDWDRNHGGEAELFGERRIIARDPIEYRLRKIHQIGFIHGEDHLADAQQGANQ